MKTLRATYDEIFEMLKSAFDGHEVEKNDKGKFSVIHGDTVMTNIMINNFGKIKFIDSAFIAPITDKKNFRFKKDLGGSSLFDVGVYPLSTLIFLLKKKNYKIINSKTFYKKNIVVDMMGEANIRSNKIQAKYSWGYNFPYQNYIKIIGTKGALTSKFIFSKKISQATNIRITFKNKNQNIKIKKSNQINNAFNFYLNRTKSKNYYEKNISLLNMLSQIKKNSEKNPYVSKN